MLILKEHPYLPKCKKSWNATHDFLSNSALIPLHKIPNLSRQFSFRAVFHPNCETSPKPVFLFPNHDPWWDHGDDLKLRIEKRSQNGMNLSAKEWILSPRKRSHYVHYTVRTLSRYKLKTMSGVLCRCIGLYSSTQTLTLSFDFRFPFRLFLFSLPLSSSLSLRSSCKKVLAEQNFHF